MSREVTRHERHLAAVLGVEHIITFGYARHGLISILVAAGLRSGDEVVLSPLTCKVVPLALMSLGLRPVYADICSNTLNLDAAAVEAAVTSGTRAVLFQHTYGNLDGVAGVEAVARRRGVLFVEDGAQCLPTRLADYTPGRWGDATIFSNNLMKPLPAGSGGLVSTNDLNLATRIRAQQTQAPVPPLRHDWWRRAEVWVHRQLVRPILYWPLFELNRRIASAYQSQEVIAEISSDITARACRISGWQARRGEAALDTLDAAVAHRRAACAMYGAGLRGLGGIRLPCLDSAFPLYYFPVLVSAKDALLATARRRLTQIVAWPIRTPIYPVETEATLRQYGYEPGSCAVAEDVARRLVGLPTDPSIPVRHIRRVTALIEEHQNRLGVPRGH
ncbi:MAG TPA: DegT/DnrJ/EryC1/StrS family aminotransferase [Vicinamibacterales bacterium]|nr:DegT/DnrJ/EryC1/StrS family aminotransferase [Vicinamibacterales bacterium]